MVFEVSPSDLEDLYCEKTWFDLRHKVQLRFQFEQTKVIQDYQNLALIISAAFGGKKSGGDPRRSDGPSDGPPGSPPRTSEAVVPSNFSDLMRSMKSVLGKE